MPHQRQWLDGPLALKMIAGLALMGIPAYTWFFEGFIRMRLFILGLLGLVLFLWAVLSIGDIKTG